MARGGGRPIGDGASATGRVRRGTAYSAESERSARHRLGSPVERADRRGGRNRDRGRLRRLAARPRERRLLQLVEDDHDGGDRTTDRPGRGHARPALRSASAQAKRPIYWVGPRSGQTYELTRTASGRVYIRYLPPGAKIGNRRADYTIVGTYPTKDALKVLQDLAKQPTEKSVPAPGGGIAVYATNAPTNVYVAFPGSDEQIEVFDPSATRALRLVTSGRVAPVG